MPTLRSVADFYGLTSELQMAAKLGLKRPVSTLALIKAYEHVPPVAHFSVDTTTGTIPFTAHFTDESRGFITSRLWDFGDTQTSNEVNPAHPYTTTNCGQFFPTLTVKNAAGQDKFFLGITARPQPPSAKIGASTLSGTAPLKVQFQDQSTVPCFHDRLWTFPNGNQDPEQNPVFTFENHGTAAIDQTVTLVVTGAGGASTTWATVHVDPEPAGQQPPPGGGQGTDPYIYVDLDPSTQTITVHGTHFPNGQSAIVDVYDVNNVHTTYPTDMVVGGVFNLQITIAGCTGGHNNKLYVRATWDNGAHYVSAPDPVIC